MLRPYNGLGFLRHSAYASPHSEIRVLQGLTSA